MNFSELPDDVVNHIYSFLPLRDASALSQGDRALQQIFYDQRLSRMITKAQQLHQQQLKEAEQDLARKKQAEEDERGYIPEAVQDARVNSEEVLQNAQLTLHLPLPNAQADSLTDIEEGLKNPLYAQQLFAYLSIIPSQTVLAWFAQQYQLPLYNFRADAYADTYTQRFFADTPLSDDESITCSLTDTQIYSSMRFFATSPMSTRETTPVSFSETSSEEERAPSRMSGLSS